MPLDLNHLSSTEIEREFPYTSKVILRTPWRTHEQLAVNDKVHQLANDYFCGRFNRMRCYHFARQDQAAAFTDFIRQGRYHRLRPDCCEGPSQQELALEWLRLCDERQSILAWGRVGSRLQEVVMAYRFHRKIGCGSEEAHRQSALAVAALDGGVSDPLNHAGVLIEWAEREHRAWFWRCCLRHHVL